MLAVKELALEGKLNGCKELNSLNLFPKFGANFYYQYGGFVGTHPNYEIALKSKF